MSRPVPLSLGLLLLFTALDETLRQHEEAAKAATKTPGPADATAKPDQFKAQTATAAASIPRPGFMPLAEPLQPTITITIDGKVGIGKSAIALTVVDALRAAGVVCQYKDEAEERGLGGNDIKALGVKPLVNVVETYQTTTADKASRTADAVRAGEDTRYAHDDRVDAFMHSVNSMEYAASLDLVGDRACIVASDDGKFQTVLVRSNDRLTGQPRIGFTFLMADGSHVGLLRSYASHNERDAVFFQANNAPAMMRELCEVALGPKVYG